MKKLVAFAIASLLATGVTYAQIQPSVSTAGADTSVVESDTARVNRLLKLMMAARAAQRVAPQIPINQGSVIKSYYLELSFNKTVSIIFSSPVRSVDLGSRFIIADKAADVENVLKVKASVMGFNETNFSVITADGKFWSFMVNYSESPSILALNLAYSPGINDGVSDPESLKEAGQSTGGSSASKAGKNQEVVKNRAANPVEKANDPVSTIPSFNLDGRSDYLNGRDAKDGAIVFSGVRATQADVVKNCEKILRKRRTVRHLGVEKNQMEASVKGVFVKDNVFYYRVTLENKSNINYDVDYVRFFIIDKAVAKLSSTQEVEVLPFYTYHDEQKTIRGNSVVERVYTFQKFTIPDNKRLVVMAGEVNGGRSLSFGINNSDIMDADKLN